MSAGRSVISVFVLAGLAMAQEGVDRFTSSPTEHIIDEIDHPFVVRSVRGIVTFGGPVVDALFEIQGPGVDKRIRHAIADKDGRFRIRHVPQGDYGFKVTYHGLRSVMGRITVTKHASEAEQIAIEMQAGV